MNKLIPFIIVFSASLTAGIYDVKPIERAPGAGGAGSPSGTATTSNPTGAPRGSTPAGTKEAQPLPNTPANLGQPTPANSSSSPSTGASVDKANWHNGGSGSGSNGGGGTGGSLYNDSNWPAKK